MTAAADDDDEDFRLLDEFVCNAVPADGVPLAGGRGEDAGITMYPELSDRIRLPSTEVLLDRPFATLSREEQDRLLTTVRGLLLTHAEVRIAERADRA